jgi:hypothetical protein
MAVKTGLETACCAKREQQGDARRAIHGNIIAKVG